MMMIRTIITGKKIEKNSQTKTDARTVLFGKTDQGGGVILNIST